MRGGNVYANIDGGELPPFGPQQRGRQVVSGKNNLLEKDFRKGGRNV
jgi:hypothetical protein